MVRPLCLTIARLLKHRPAYASTKLCSASLSSHDIRKKFIEFYQLKHKHEFVPSSSVYLPNDPTLNFVNAGMNQFKEKFLNVIDPRDELARVKRAVNSQKCIRAGGKHNDLEDVGYDTSHHTFFEMLGSWSFGDYFKDDACEMALELLIDRFKLPMERLYFTYFSGDNDLSLEPDFQTRDIWKKLGISESRILPFGMNDNFWRMGDTGPCGPCTEIHYDYSGQRNASDLVNQGHRDVVEIWNLVFMQFNCLPGGKLVHLPMNHVDTGMGFERIAAVLQGTKSNYDTDLFLPIIKKIKEICSCPSYTGQYTDEDIAYRIISDHIRMLVVAIGDSVYPGNVGSELTVRQVLRRANRRGRENLSAPDEFLASLVPDVVDSLCDHYPNLKDDEKEITRIIENEEQRFLKVLKKGELIIKGTAKNMKKGETEFPVKTAINLYNHHGYPLDLILKAAKERNLSFDTERFTKYQEERELLHQKGRDAMKHEKKKALITASTLNELSVKNIPYTKDDGKFHCIRNTDLTYTFPSLESTILAVISEEGVVMIEGLFNENMRLCALVLENTLFSHEKDGHASDTGVISFGEDEAFQVVSVTYAGGYVFHHGFLSNRNISIGDVVTLCIDTDNRQACMRANTATYLLHQALRDVLGKITPRGSKLEADDIRLDFTGLAPSQDDLKKILNIMESKIDSDRSVLRDRRFRDTDIISGTTSSSHDMQETNELDANLVHKTGDIGRFVIISCKSQGPHKTRIRCLTGKLAEEALCLEHQYQAEIHQNFKEAQTILDNESASTDQAESLIKEIGRLGFKIKSSGISVPSKTDMNAKLYDLSKKLRIKSRISDRIKSQKNLVNGKYKS